EVLADLSAYWKRRLKGMPSLLALPTDRPRPPVQTFQGAMYIWRLPQHLVKKLRILSQQEHVTLFMLLLSAFIALLHRASGQEDIVVGSPSANRTRAELEGLIGFFINRLLLRTTCSDRMSFRDFLEQ